MKPPRNATRSALGVGVVTGLARRFRLSEDHHVYRWWAVAAGSIAVVVVAGSFI